MQGKNLTAANLRVTVRPPPKAGQPCRGYAIEGSRYCFAHDPAKAAERAQARIKGGKARHGRKRPQWPI